MANTTDIERLNYYEGEYLGRHRLSGPNRNTTATCAAGTTSVPIPGALPAAFPSRKFPTAGAGGQVDVSLMPGMAIDGFGREIVVLTQHRLPRISLRLL